MEIYKNSKHVTVTYNEAKNYCLFSWINMAIPLADLKELHMKALDMVKTHNIKTLVAETSNAQSVLFQECIDWWSNEHVPRLDNAGLKSIITVKGGNALTRLTNKSWQGATGAINLYEVQTLQDAEALMAEKTPV